MVDCIWRNCGNLRYHDGSCCSGCQGGGASKTVRSQAEPGNENNRTRAIENMAYVVASNQGSSLRSYPPFSWPGGSMIVDYDGRVLARAEPGPGERIVVGATRSCSCGNGKTRSSDRSQRRRNALRAMAGLP